ncbi:MAG: glycoside hydrolase family 127 protein, partial [Clostridia bacterium]|nr:glycoside hydrolase family 127 protein [Clostridia bacterium]
MKNISYKNTVITDGFWKIKQDMIKDVTLESVYNRFKETHRFDALDCSWKEGDPDCPHVFWDSDIAKWLEGLAYILAHSENEKLEKIADESIEKIEKNRDENGYYNSHFLVTGEKFTIRNEHELYCAGHLMEAAVAYYEATGKKLLLDIMCKYADYIEKAFVKEKTAKFVTPGHPEIELALVKMYEVTGEKRYLDLSKFFVDNHGDNDVDGLVYNGCRITYNQDECAVRDRKTAEGHCVRALYLFCAMADIAYYYDDKELFAAAERCFENIVNKRMYITGATGSTCHGESF